MRAFLMICGVAMVLMIVPPLHAQDSPTLPAITNDVANFRAGPELTYPILATLDLGVPLQLDGRRGDNLWLHGIHNGQSGWVFAALLTVEGDINLLPVLVGSPTTATESAMTTASPETTNTETTNNVANFRMGPSTAYSTIATLPANTPLTVTGRNADGTWLQVTVDDQPGWIFAALVMTDRAMSDLAVQDAPALSADTIAVPTTNTSGTPTSSGIVSGIGPRAAQIFSVGQTLGNRADVFSKVGDSISANPVFLYPIGSGGVILDAHAYLQPTIDYFMQTPARTNNSFANDSVAVRSGWTSADVLLVGNGPSGVCLADESPLVCEYRISKPAVALIMFGTNDILRAVDNTTFRANMQSIITISIDRGVIPVISTIPDNLNGQGQRVLELNAIIRSLASANGIPLWDYWSALQGLPGSGISSDGYHPSLDPGTQQTGVFTPQYLQYGYNMRNYTALVVLDAMRRQVLIR